MDVESSMRKAEHLAQDSLKDVMKQHDEVSRPCMRCKGFAQWS